MGDGVRIWSMQYAAWEICTGESGAGGELARLRVCGVAGCERCGTEGVEGFGEGERGLLRVGETLRARLASLAVP